MKRCFSSDLPANFHPFVPVRLRAQHLGHDALGRAGRRSARSNDRWSGKLRGRADKRPARLRRRLHGSAADYPHFTVHASADALGRSRASPGKRGCHKGSAHHDSHISSSLVSHTSDQSRLTKSRLITSRITMSRSITSRIIKLLPGDADRSRRRIAGGIICPRRDRRALVLAFGFRNSPVVGERRAG